MNTFVGPDQLQAMEEMEQKNNFFYGRVSLPFFFKGIQDFKKWIQQKATDRSDRDQRDRLLSTASASSGGAMTMIDTTSSGQKNANCES